MKLLYYAPCDVILALAKMKEKHYMPISLHTFMHFPLYIYSFFNKITKQNKINDYHGE